MSLQLKRRTAGSGAPGALKSGQPAFNETDEILYYGKGDDGSGNATSILAIGGKGAFLALTGAQTIAGVKTFTSAPKIPNATANDEPYRKDQVDTALSSKANLASPALTGTPTAPTAGAGTNTTQIATTGFVTSQIGAANGIAGLGADGKVPTSQLPSSLVGGVAYQGTWNANTNTPTIPAASAGNKGYYYKVSVDGATNIDGITDWKVGDWIVSNGATWDKIDNTEAVSSVAGRTGAISLTTTDISGLGTLATQNANAVNITGGTIGSGVSIDDGTF